MRKIMMLSAGIVALLGPQPLLAQDLGLETVIVTARKRAEDLQAVPISITAFDQAALDRLSVRTIEDLRYATPSVYIAPTTFRQDTLNVTIRGQRDFDSSSGQSVMSFDTAAAIYVDGVYMARPVGLTGALFDVDSVDVLKGPQGTLVGRNSTGGAILYRTREPDDTFGGYLKVTGGDYGRAEAQGALNIPLTDNLFFRAAVLTSNQRGYLTNMYTDPATGFTNRQPAMGSNKMAANLSLKYVGDESFNVILRVNLAGEHDTGSSYHDLGYFVGTVPRNNRPSICNIPGTCTGFTDLLGHVIAPSYLTVALPNTVTGLNPAAATYNSLLSSIAREQAAGFWSVEQTVSNLDVGHYQTVSGEVNKSFSDDITVQWLTSYRWWDNAGTSVGRGLPYDTATYIYDTPNYTSWQSELTVNGTALEDKLKWTAGAFYFQEQSPNDGGLFYLYLPSANTPAAAAGRQITLQDRTTNDLRNTSYAAYAQATYSIWSDTRVTAGVRYTYDERFAHLATQTVTFPSLATMAPLPPLGQFSATPYVLNGISYSGQTRSCTLTDVNGKPLPLANCSVDINRSFHKPTYTLAVDHDVWDGTLVYATMRSGYRAGAINSSAIQPAVIVAAPEQVTDYEAGIKSDWDLLGIPVRTNLAGYFSNYHNLQILTSLPNVTLATGPGGVPCTQALYNAAACPAATNDNVTLNANKAHIYGAEWDITAIPLPGLTLNYSGSYLDARYTDYTFSPPPGYLLPSGTTNLSGTPFPLPTWQMNGTASYATGVHNLILPVDDLILMAHYYWQGRYLADMRNFDPSQRTSPYGLLNLRMRAVNLAGSHMDLSLFMTNVVNTEACYPEYNGVLNSAPNASFGIANTAGVLQCVPLPPRMTGMSLEYKF